MTTEPREREEVPERIWIIRQHGSFLPKHWTEPAALLFDGEESFEYIRADLAATRMRERCVGAVKQALADEQRKWRDGKAINQYELGQRAAFTHALAALESLTLDEKEPPTHA